jgi:hypothetical protein
MTSSCLPDDFSRYLLAAPFLPLAPERIHNYAGDTREHLIHFRLFFSASTTVQAIARRPSTHNKYIII